MIAHPAGGADGPPGPARPIIPPVTAPISANRAGRRSLIRSRSLARSSGRGAACLKTGDGGRELGGPAGEGVGGSAADQLVPHTAAWRFAASAAICSAPRGATWSAVERLERYLSPPARAIHPSPDGGDPPDDVRDARAMTARPRRGRVQHRVERDEQGAGADDAGTGGRVRARRADIGRSRSQPRGELLEAAAAGPGTSRRSGGAPHHRRRRPIHSARPGGAHRRARATASPWTSRGADERDHPRRRRGGCTPWCRLRSIRRWRARQLQADRSTASGGPQHGEHERW
jgi:hypothetical protein